MDRCSAIGDRRRRGCCYREGIKVHARQCSIIRLVVDRFFDACDGVCSPIVQRALMLAFVESSATAMLVVLLRKILA